MFTVQGAAFTATRTLRDALGAMINVAARVIFILHYQSVVAVWSIPCPKTLSTGWVAHECRWSWWDILGYIGFWSSSRLAYRRVRRLTSSRESSHQWLAHQCLPAPEWGGTCALWWHQGDWSAARIEVPRPNQATMATARSRWQIR